MLRVRDYSISAKLTWMNMLVSAAALLLACAAFVAYDLLTFRETLLRNLSTQAQIVGANSASALLFNDPPAAEKTLSALQASPNIVSAGIYTADGQPFAAYQRDHAGQPVSLPPMPATQSQIRWLKDQQVVLVRPIMFQGKATGTVYIRSDLHELFDRLKRYVIIVIAVLAASLLAALLTSSIFRRAIADPIVRLAETARTVSRDKIYSVRAPTTHNRDELAILIGTFNEMLAQIQERDTALQFEIKERKQAEEALRASEQRTRLIIETALDAAIAMDADGVITGWNAQAETVFGWTSQEVLARSLAETIIPDRYREAHRIGMQRYVATGEAVVLNKRIELVALHRNGQEFPIELSITPIRTGATLAFSAFVRDITQRKADEREIRKLNDELEERVIQRTAQLAEANKELEAFTYSVSHDLRAPLRHMAGFSGLLLEEFGSTLDSQGQHYVRRIQEGTRKMGQLVDELLSLARVGRQSPKLQVAGLDSMVEEVVAILKPEWDGRDVEWKIAALPSVACDPTLMKQVFQNLLSNALKYSRPRTRAVIDVGSALADGKPVIFVRDNGVGFNMKYYDKLFGVFQRLHRPEEFEGTGVGLATVQRILKKHGGRVWAEAELDKGATFYFTVDVAASAEPKSSTASAGTGV